jgi:hypothetical protein
MRKCFPSARNAWRRRIVKALSVTRSFTTSPLAIIALGQELFNLAYLPKPVRDPNEFQVLMLRSAQILGLLRSAQILFDGTRN